MDYTDIVLCKLLLSFVPHICGLSDSTRTAWPRVLETLHQDWVARALTPGLLSRGHALRLLILHENHVESIVYRLYYLRLVPPILTPRLLLQLRRLLRDHLTLLDLQVNRLVQQ